MYFSDEQIDKLSSLFLDIAKGLFLASFVVPAISSLITIASVIRSILVAIFFTYLSLKLLDLKKEAL